MEPLARNEELERTIDNLLCRLQHDDKPALGFLAGLIAPVLLPMLQNWWRVPESDCDDIVSETLHGLWRARYRYSSKGKGIGWVVQIARCHALDHMRALCTRRRLESNYAVARIETDQIEVSLLEFVADWLRGLSSTDRLIASAEWKQGFGGESCRQLAPILNLSIFKVKRRWLQLKQELNDLVQTELGNEKRNAI